MVSAAGSCRNHIAIASGAPSAFTVASTATSRVARNAWIPAPSRVILSRLRQLRTADDPEVAPLADSQILGLLEVADRAGVRGRIREVRLHRADGETELLLDRLESLVAPRELRHFRLPEVSLEEVDLRRRHAEHLGGVQGVAAELERGAVGRAAARLPVD